MSPVPKPNFEFSPYNLHKKMAAVRIFNAVAVIQVVQVVRCTRAHDLWGPTSEDQIAIF